MAHQYTSGAVGGNQEMGCTKGGLNTRVHLGVDGPGMPYRIVVTEGAAADVSHAIELIEQNIFWQTRHTIHTRLLSMLCLMGCQLLSLRGRIVRIRVTTTRRFTKRDIW